MNEPFPDKRILNFIRRHHLFTLATLNRQSPWTASCFYVFVEGTNEFVFTSGMDTLHGRNMIENNEVAGNIALETKIIGKIQGIQFTGKVKKLEGDELAKAKKAYTRRFPMAMLMETVLWKFEVDMIKMTDNTFGFGKKLYWYKDSENSVKSRD
jgi:uncharacterized protein YhbP (UPF0306 family)